MIAEVTTKDRLGLTAVQQPFYKQLTTRLTGEIAATNCVTEALCFWQKWNSGFTGVDEIDHIIRCFVIGQADGWDKNPFDHYKLVSKDSDVRKYLHGIGFTCVVEPEDFKGLFMCESDKLLTRRYNHGKKVGPVGLRNALAVVNLDADISAITASVRWSPPFTPGILFLCQLRLMMDSFSDTKEGRTPPTLEIARNSATFTFDAEIETALCSMEWQKPGNGSHSCAAMRAMSSASIGGPNVDWKHHTAACTVTKLLNGREEVITVRPCSKKVLVSWTV